MSRDPLFFERMAIRRMPGIHDGGFTLEDLSPGVNIVHGPNASGKTTAARAIESLLWPKAAAPARASLLGRFALGAGRWSTDLDAGHVRYQRAGADTGAPALPPAEARDRYHLSLHELLGADNRNLAVEIIRESAGGYDLSAAAAALGCRATASRCTAELNALGGARGRLKEATAKQEALRGEEARLRELEEKAAEAEDAGRRVRLLERAVEHAQAVAEERSARQALSAFPEGMAALRGDEAGRLEEIRRKLGDARARLATAEGDRAAADADLEKADLPEGGPGDDVLASLGARLQVLRDLDRAVATKEQELAGAEARRDEERGAIGAAVDDARLQRIDHVAMDALSGFARAAGEARAELQAAAALLRWLGDGSVPEDLEPVEHGVRLLRQWLRSGGSGGGPQRGLRTYGAVAAGVLLLAGLLAGFANPLLFLLAALGGVLLFLILRSGQGADPRQLHRGEFERLGVERPASWSTGSVEACLDRLTRRLAEGRVAEERARRRADAAARRATAEAAWKGLELERAELAGRFGVAPELDAAHLYWLANRISRWQDAVHQVSAVSAALDAARQQRADALDAARERVAAFGYEAVADLADLEGVVRDLDRRWQHYRQAANASREAARRLEDARAAIEELKKDGRALLGRLGLGEDGEDVVADWCARHEGYVAARDRVLFAEKGRREAATRLAETPGYTAGVEAQPVDALADERGAAAGLAGELQPLREAIAGIRARVAEAKRGHDVEAALAEVERCEAALREARERDTLAVVGHALVAFVQQATRDRHRPEVFHRARELFTRITHGRYRLDFDDGDPPSFRACDETTGTGHALDELSSATRVQLLMAVRIAFVERQESGVRLPLVFDETLGNSDDHRAEAIMEAILALAAEGRQVFYFTAQPDEVGKWRGMLQRHPGVPSQFIDLVAVRRLARYRGLPALEVLAPPVARIPEPDGATHAEYGRLLQVPPIDPDADVGGTHLWHLVEDPEALYRLLCLRAETWGALRSLVRNGGGDLLGPDAEWLARPEAAARALAAAIDLVKVGRGRPVDRSALLDSGAISDTFMDRVDRLCRECGGSAARLIEALDEGRLARFRNDAREKLREYLDRNGYLDPREPLDAGELREGTLSAVAAEIGAGLLTVQQIDRLLSRLPAFVPA